MRFIIPTILLIAAVGLFALYTNPTYQAAQGVQAQVASYNEALTQSQEIVAVRNQLLSKYNTFSSQDVQDLQTVLPDNVDNIRLIIDINNIASRHNLALGNVALGSVSNSPTSQSNLSSGVSGSAVGSVEVGFSVTTSYENMLSFLQDLEHSLRLIDVTGLSFSAGGKDDDTYSFTIRTYWLH